MTIAFVNKGSAAGKAVALTGVTLGNLIVCLLQWQDNATTPTLSDGTNSPDGYGAVVNNGTSEYIRFAYWLASPKSGNVTYTWTASGGGHTAHVYEMSCGTRWELCHIDAGGTGSTSPAISANETTDKTPMVSFGAAGVYDDGGYTSATIDGVAVDDYTADHDAAYYSLGVVTRRIVSNPGTYNSTITFTAVHSVYTYTADLIAFMEAIAIPKAMADYRMRRN